MAEVNGHGLEVSLPRGWEGRIYRRPDGSALRGSAASAEAAEAAAPTYPVLHVGNFPLPPDAADFGSGAVDRMVAGDVFMALFEYDPASTATALFAAQGVPGPLLASDFTPDVLQRTIPGQAGVQRFFSAEGRAFCLYIVIGSYAGRASVVSMVNEALATLVIAPSPDVAP